MESSNRRQWAQIDLQQIVSASEKNIFYCDGDQILEQVAQKSCGEVYTPGGIQT